MKLSISVINDTSKMCMYIRLCVIDIKINKVKKRKIGKGAAIRKKEN